LIGQTEPNCGVDKTVIWAECRPIPGQEKIVLVMELAKLYGKNDQFGKKSNAAIKAAC